MKKNFRRGLLRMLLAVLAVTALFAALAPSSVFAGGGGTQYTYTLTKRVQSSQNENRYPAGIGDYTFRLYTSGGVPIVFDSVTSPGSIDSTGYELTVAAAYTQGVSYTDTTVTFDVTLQPADFPLKMVEDWDGLSVTANWRVGLPNHNKLGSFEVDIRAGDTTIRVTNVYTYHLSTINITKTWDVAPPAGTDVKFEISSVIEKSDDPSVVATTHITDTTISWPAGSTSETITFSNVLVPNPGTASSNPRQVQIAETLPNGITGGTATLQAPIVIDDDAYANSPEFVTFSNTFTPFQTVTASVEVTKNWTEAGGGAVPAGIDTLVEVFDDADPTNTVLASHTFTTPTAPYTFNLSVDEGTVLRFEETVVASTLPAGSSVSPPDGPYTITITPGQASYNFSITFSNVYTEPPPPATITVTVEVRMDWEGDPLPAGVGTDFTLQTWPVASPTQTVIGIGSVTWTFTVPDGSTITVTEGAVTGLPTGGTYYAVGSTTLTITASLTDTSYHYILDFKNHYTAPPVTPPPTPVVPGPFTGDTSNMVFWAALAAVSLTAVVWWLRRNGFLVLRTAGGPDKSPETPKISEDIGEKWINRE